MHQLVHGILFGGNNFGRKTTGSPIIADGGSVHILGQNIDEADVRARIGYAAGGAAFYPRKTVAQIAAMTKSFYPRWDEEAFAHYLQVFHLGTGKQLRQLSEGMKVKFQLALALSHGAKLLILDGTKIRIVFTENSAFEPVIANMILTFKEPINILKAATKNVGGGQSQSFLP